MKRLLCLLLFGFGLLGVACDGDDATPTRAPTANATTAPPAETAATTPTATNGGDLVTTPSGLQYRDEVVGSGAQPKRGQSVTVHYTGRLEDGTEFDSSRGGDPFTFTIGIGEVIAGWDEGVATMKAGGKRTLVIPPELGYGAEGFPGAIPPNATLIFDVELISVQ